jgi:hypothetical protein
VKRVQFSRQLTVYDAIRTSGRDHERARVRIALFLEWSAHTRCIRSSERNELAELPPEVAQRERLRIATETMLRRHARERLRELVRAVLEQRGQSKEARGERENTLPVSAHQKRTIGGRE